MEKLTGRLSGVQSLTAKLSLGVRAEQSVVLISKQITENGTYLARNDSADGYSAVSAAIPIPPEKVLMTKTITENGSYSAEDDNADGYSSVSVAIPIPPEKVLTTKTITENGSYSAEDDNADGYSAVSVAIPIPPEKVLTTKTITENGSYSAQNDNADGYSSVIVAVQPDFLIEPYIRDLTGGWVNSDSSTNTSAIWTIQSGTQNLSDLYRVEADAHYIISLDGSPGNRFRPMFTEVDVSQATSNVTGVKIMGTYSSSQLSNPTAYYHLTYTAPSDGYIAVQKSNAGQTGVKTYLFKMP